MLVLRGRMAAPSDADVPANFIPSEQIKRLDDLAAEEKALKQVLEENEWTVLLFFRPTDCYSCVMYAQQLEDELQVHKGDSLQLAAVAVETNAGELRSFLRSVELPYPVFVAPVRSEAQSFYQALDRIAPTPLLTLLKGHRVRYAARLWPDDRVMEERFGNLLEKISETAEQPTTRIKQ